jgi:hypothetical protein
LACLIVKPNNRNTAKFREAPGRGFGISAASLLKDDGRDE